jgi:hypothetical protein
VDEQIDICRCEDSAATQLKGFRPKFVLPVTGHAGAIAILEIVAPKEPFAPTTSFARDSCGLPDVGGGDAWRAGAVSDDLRFQNDFDVFAFPIGRYFLQHFIHAL